MVDTYFKESIWNIFPASIDCHLLGVKVREELLVVLVFSTLAFILFLTEAQHAENTCLLAAVVYHLWRNIVPREPPQLLDGEHQLAKSILPVILLTGEFGFGVDVFVDLFSQSSLLELQGLDDLEEDFFGAGLISSFKVNWRYLE